MPIENFDSFLVSTYIKKHLEKIIKERSIILTGDTEHLSIDNIINTVFVNIDKPRQYEFQKETVHEDDLLFSLERLVPFIFPATITEKVLEDVFSGKMKIKLPEYYESRCADCAEKMFMTVKGNEVHIDCRHKCTKNNLFTVEVDFPTGEIVYGDWPARFSEATDAGILKDDSGNINYLKGQRERTNEMVAQQVFHHYVGNSCPRWYFNKDESKINIGGGTYDDDSGDSTMESGFEEKGFICTDLWWTTFVDRKFYDIMMSKLPENRDEQYYKKDVETAYIKPGRYRFTCHGAVGYNNHNSIYASAEWIGEASDFVPNYQALDDDEKIMSLDDAVACQMAKYAKEYVVHPDTVKFQILDQSFNASGSMRNKGEFYSAYKINNKIVIPTYVPRTDVEPVFKSGYSTFKKEYTGIYNIGIENLPEDWIDGAAWFYQKCKEYFLDGASDYNYAYPCTARNADRDTKDFEEAIERVRKENMTESQFFEAVSKAYECDYNGDLHDFRTRRWAKEKRRCLDFIEETLEMISKYQKSQT